MQAHVFSKHAATRQAQAGAGQVVGSESKPTTFVGAKSWREKETDKLTETNAQHRLAQSDMPHAGQNTAIQVDYHQGWKSPSVSLRSSCLSPWSEWFQMLENLYNVETGYTAVSFNANMWVISELISLFCI